MPADQRSSEPTWPLVGREEDMRRLASALDHGRTDTPTAILIRGPSGIGKTRLAREGLAAAAAGGWATRWTAATRATRKIPFAALADLLEGDVDDPLQLFRRTAHGLRSRAGERRVVVGVDDAHLLDQSSAALLHHLVAGGVAVVATMRDGAPLADPLPTLAGDDRTVTVQLQPVAQVEATSLLRRVLGDEVDAGAGHRLWLLSGGNPQLLRAVVRAALERGGLRLDHGRWRLRGPVVDWLTLPAAAARRLEGLPPEAGAALEVAAIAEPVPVGLLEAIVGPALEAAEEAGLVTLTTDGLCRVHPPFGEVLRTRVPALRLRRVSRQLAEAAAEAGVMRPGDTLRLATWKLAAGERTDPALFERAASQARAAFDHPLAERLAAVAVEGGAGFAARLLHAESVCAQGDVERAVRLLAELQDDADDDGQLVQAVSARAFTLLQAYGHAEEADRLLQLAQGVVDDPARHDELATARASLAMNRGHFAAAVAITAPLHQRPDSALGIRMGAGVVGVPSLAIAGRPCEALEIAARLIDAAKTGGQEPALIEHLLGLGRCLALAFAGRLAEAGEVAWSRYHVALEEGNDRLRGDWALPLGSIALLCGRPATAAARLREAAALIGEQVTELSRFPQAYCLGSLAEAAALAGDEEGAAAALTRARTAAPAAYVPTVDRGEVWLTVARGELSRARELAGRAAERAAAHGAHAFEALALHDQARLGVGELVAARLRRLAARLDGPIWRVLASHAVATAQDDAAELERSGQRLAELGFALLGAEATAQAAAAHRARGRPGSAMAAARLAEQRLARCEDARTPALLPGPVIGEQDLLTAREHEIAGLAARGLTNRRIAETLFLSPRTVANHLYRIYAKLNITGRDTLAQVLG